MSSATACVLGDLDLVAPLVMADVRCAVLAPPGDPARYSRRATPLEWADPRSEPERLLAVLERHSSRFPVKPVLYYQTDAYTTFVSEHRERLARCYDFVIAGATLLGQLNDKVRFCGLAQAAGLPVPASSILATAEAPPKHVSVTFPALVKPPTRDDVRWAQVERSSKVVEVTDRAHLESLWPRLQRYGGDVVLQELIPGPETAILSYHCYARGGVVIADFTGAKLRTRPAKYGHSTALTITDDPDVTQLGRDIVGRLELDGVAKLDLKQAPDGSLRLLEINPRFNLWHHPAAIAGVNLPALVWADLTGAPRPAVTRPKPGTHWMSPWDLQAARDEGMSLASWLAWARGCQARSMMAWDDPLPFLRLSSRRAGRWVRRLGGA